MPSAIMIMIITQRSTSKMNKKSKMQQMRP